MKKKIVIWPALVIIALAFGTYGFIKLPGTKDSSRNETQSGIYNFESIQDEVLKGTAVLYDVRTSAEYSEGKFNSAVNYPLQDLQSGKSPITTKDKKIYVYCRSGNRSEQAVKILKDSGFTRVIDLRGLSDVQKIGGKLIN